MASRDNVKQWFKTEDKPTQAQFWQLFDSLFFKDEGIGLGNVAGLIPALQGKADKNSVDAFVMGERIEVSGDYEYNLLQNYLLEKIIVLPGADTVLRIGLSAGGEDVSGPDMNITQANGGVFVVNLFAKAARTIYFTGLPAGSSIIILKRLIKTA